MGVDLFGNTKYNIFNWLYQIKEDIIENYTTLEKALKDKKLWDKILEECDKEFLLEIENARSQERFKHCDFQNFLDYLEKQSLEKNI